MRILTVCFVLIAGWTEAQPAPPVVRAAYADSSTPKVVSLKDRLHVVACKVDFDAWKSDPKSPASVSLYMNGMLLGPEAKAEPMLPEQTAGNKELEAVLAECAKGAAEKLAAAKTAAAEPDAAAKDEGVKAAATLAAGPEAASKQLVVFTFYLDSKFVIQEKTKEAWRQLLERPWRDDMAVIASVGPADGSPWPSRAGIQLQRINMYWLVGWIVLFLVAVWRFVVYAQDSEIIRDPGQLPTGTPAAIKKAYSLARTQMAIWTFLVAGALAFLFLVTWNENTLTNGVLVLIGISFSTTLMAATADGVPPSDGDVALAEKNADDAADAAAKAAATAAAEPDPIKQKAALAVANKKVEEAKIAAASVVTLKSGVAVAKPSTDFWTDILTDGKGPSFHRYQMVLFTVILAVIFVAKTGTSLIMPEFDPTLLGLMGISSGTYLGFKLQGK